MTEVFESLLRITHGTGGSAVVLLDFDADVTGLPSLDGGQNVDLKGFLRAAGKKAFSRGNDSHVFRIPLAIEGEDIKSAHERLFAGAVAVPKVEADVTFEVFEGRTFVLRNACVQSWPGAVDEHFTTRDLVIVGGELEEVI